MSHGDAVVDSEAHVLDHLAGVKLYDEDTLLAPGGFLDSLRGERPEGFDNNSGILFNQWRAYNNGFFKWNNDESAYLNILHGTEPRSGSMPADKYTAWLGYDTHTNTTNVTSNDLTFDNGR